MILKKLLFVLLFFATTSVVIGQINVSEFIQQSKIATTTNNKLYFVDFWATWCAPCLVAKEQLTVLQRQFPKDFYIVSLSSENPAVVERFLKRKHAKLAVAIDYDKQTFKNYKVNILPYGILFNANGDVLWTGNSADLKASTISKFLKQTTKRIALNTFFNIKQYNLASNDSYVPIKAIELNPLNNTVDFKASETKDYLKITGNIAEIYGYLAHIYKNQISVSPKHNKHYEVYFKKPFTTKKDLARLFLNSIHYNVNKTINEGDVLHLNVKNANFWDTHQINWGTNVSKYIIGDADITADNSSLKDLAYQLATVLNKPVVITGYDSTNTTLHDWQIHYKYFNFMKNNFADYGIAIENTSKTYDVYHLKKGL